jgi:hypothetical protein
MKYVQSNLTLTFSVHDDLYNVVPLYFLKAGTEHLDAQLGVAGRGEPVPNQSQAGFKRLFHLIQPEMKEEHLLSSIRRRTSLRLRYSLVISVTQQFCQRFPVLAVKTGVEQLCRATHPFGTAGPGPVEYEVGAGHAALGQTLDRKD